MKKEFYSNGKLLITGEYLVLDGGKSFALPTNLKLPEKHLLISMSTKKLRKTVSKQKSNCLLKFQSSLDIISLSLQV